MTDLQIPLTDAELDDIRTRAAHLAEYTQLPTEAERLADKDVPALLAEIERLRQKDRDAMVWEARLAGHAWAAVDGGHALAAALTRLTDEWMTNAEAIVLADTDERDPHQSGIADALTTCAMVVRGLLAESRG